MAGSCRSRTPVMGVILPPSGRMTRTARERLVPSDFSHNAWYGIFVGGRGDGQNGCRDRWSYLGLVRHHMRAEPGVELGKMQTTMNWKENAPPLILWGILALSGLLGSGWV